MNNSFRAETEPLVSTIREKCKVCYTCVRECPAKAIRISGGQAEVLSDRCIGCGNCVKVCTRGAKQVRSAIGRVKELINSSDTVAAIVAPSFPAEFSDLDPAILPAALSKVGFDQVNEVAFGADLVAQEYRTLLKKNPDKKYIAVSCPAVTSFVRKYYPGLVPMLAPIVSPMIAEARALRMLYGEDLKIVFIGPCIAKKAEAEDVEVEGEINAVMTFSEMFELFSELEIDISLLKPVEFNPPSPGLGALFPISRGMLQAADISEDLVSGEIVAADGRNDFVDAIREFESGDLEARLLEILCCNGCIMGSGMTTKAPIFPRRARVSRYVRARLDQLNFNRWHIAMGRCSTVNMSRSFSADDKRLKIPSTDEIEGILHRMGKFDPEDELNCGACGYETCREHAVAIFKGLAESEMCLPYTIDELKSTVGDLASVNEELAGAKAALLHAEKMASMGQLAAGIAHEVNNPLGVVLMYSHMLLEDYLENKELVQDLKTIAEHAGRCKSIVAGLLNFARQNKVKLTETDICILIRKTTDALEKPPGIEVEYICGMNDPVIRIDENQIAQVITNLVSNAYGAMSETGGNLTISSEEKDNSAVLKFSDTGSGITEDNLKKIFEPFFTTKKSGSGTGLGLSVTYGIVKMHRGQITVESCADPTVRPTGTTFTVVLPLQREKENHGTV